MSHAFDQLARSTGTMPRRSLLAHLAAIAASLLGPRESAASNSGSSLGTPCSLDEHCEGLPVGKAICGASSTCCMPSWQPCQFDGDCCTGLRCTRHGGVAACRPKGLGDRRMGARCSNHDQCSTGFAPDGDFLRCGALAGRRVCCAPAGAVCNLYGGMRSIVECCDGASCTQQRCHRLAKLRDAIDALPEQNELPNGLTLGRLWSDSIDKVTARRDGAMDEDLPGLYASWGWLQGGGLEAKLDGDIKFELRIDGFDDDAGAAAAFEHHVAQTRVSDSETVALDGSECQESFRRYTADSWHATRIPLDADSSLDPASWLIVAQRGRWLIRIAHPRSYGCDDLQLLLNVVTDTFARLGLYPDDSDMRPLAGHEVDAAPRPSASPRHYRIGAPCSRPGQCLLSFIDSSDQLVTPTCGPVGPDPNDLRCCVEGNSPCAHPSDCCGDLICISGRCRTRGLRERPLGSRCTDATQCTTFRTPLDAVVTCGTVDGSSACCMPEGTSCAFERAICCDHTICQAGMCVPLSAAASRPTDIASLVKLPEPWTVVDQGFVSAADSVQAPSKDPGNPSESPGWQGISWIEASTREGESVHLTVDWFETQQAAREARAVFVGLEQGKLPLWPSVEATCSSLALIGDDVDAFDDGLAAGVGYSFISSQGRLLMRMLYRSPVAAAPCDRLPSILRVLDAGHSLLNDLGPKQHHR